MWRQWKTADVAMDGSNNRGGLLMQCALMVEKIAGTTCVDGGKLIVQSAL